MSQHNIVGSEAFGRRPFVYIRTLRPGSFRRRKARTAMAFAAGVIVTALAVGAAAITAFGPGFGVTG